MEKKHIRWAWQTELASSRWEWETFFGQATLFEAFATAFLVLLHDKLSPPWQDREALHNIGAPKDQTQTTTFVEKTHGRHRQRGGPIR